MQLSSSRLIGIVLGYFVAHSKAYPMQTWPVYPQAREYSDDDYYYAPKVQYYYDAPAMNVPDMYGQIPYPYFNDPYGHFENEAPKKQEDRLAALPIGQETWFENESAAPHWRANDDDVNAAFLDNLILTQMAQDAQRRRENSRAAFPPTDYEDRERDAEDEDVRELKALAGKPFYHVPKTVPKIEDDDYPADDGFINWNGNKRSVTTVAPSTTIQPKQGQDEVVMASPSHSIPRNHHDRQNKRSSEFYNTIVKLLANKSKNSQIQESAKARRIDKRFVASERDLVGELRGLKHRVAT